MNHQMKQNNYSLQTQFVGILQRLETFKKQLRKSRMNTKMAAGGVFVFVVFSKHICLLKFFNRPRIFAEQTKGRLNRFLSI